MAETATTKLETLRKRDARQLSEPSSPTPEERTTAAIDILRGDLQRFEDAAENAIIEVIREAESVAQHDERQATLAFIKLQCANMTWDMLVAAISKGEHR